MWVFSCAPLLPQLPHRAAAITPGPAPMGAHRGEWSAGIPFLPNQRVPNLGFAYLFISGNRKGGTEKNLITPRCSSASELGAWFVVLEFFLK